MESTEAPPPRRRAGSARALFAALALASAAPAQDAKPAEKTRFSAERELVGFETAQFSDAADLYDFAEYRALDGQPMTREEIDAVVAKWKAERERVQKEVAQLKVDPALRAKRRLHKRLANQPYLSRLEFVENDSFAPILFVVQRIPKAKPGFEDTVVKQQGPWLKKAFDVFEAEFKDVLPPLREGCALLPVVVLSSWGDFSNYCQTAAGGAFSGGSHYSADVGAVVCYAELMGGERDIVTERRGALYGLVHELVQSHAPDDTQPAAHWWVREGLADAFAAWSGDAKAPQVFVPNQSGVAWLSTLLANEHWRDLYFIPAQDLVAVKSSSEIYGRMRTRLSDDEDADGKWGAAVRSAFLVECGLLVSELLHGDGGSQRAVVASRLASIVTPGKGPALAPLDVAVTHKRLVAALQAESRRLKVKDPIDDALRAKLESWKPSTAGDTTANNADVAKAATGLAGSATEAAFSPAQLIAEPLPPEARLGVALRLAGIGELDAAVASCERIEGALEPGHPLRERAVRETRRLRELARWRLDFLEQWKGTNKKLRIEHDGAATAGTFKQVEEGDLVLVDAKGRDLRVSLASLDCEQVLRRAGEAKLEPGTPLVRAYAALIAGRKSWSKGLGATPEESLLKSDGAGWPALLAKGEAAARLQKLGHQSLPANAPAAAAPLVELHALLVQKDVAELVEPRREMLRRFAAACFARQFDAVGLAAAGLAGRVLRKPDGTVRVTYDFKDAAQAADWVPARLPLSTRREVPPLRTPKEKWAIRIEDGKLSAIGAAGWISKLALAAPMAVTYHYQAAPPPGVENVDVATMSVTLCDDDAGNRIETMDFAGIEIHSEKPFFFKRDFDPKPYLWDTPFDLRIEHDGAAVRFVSHGLPDRKIPATARTSGRVGIYFYSDAVMELADLEIEGHVNEQTLSPLRQGWVEAQVAALEKPDWKPAKTDKPGK
jgi:hypothetical protein